MTTIKIREERIGKYLLTPEQSFKVDYKEGDWVTVIKNNNLDLPGHLADNNTGYKTGKVFRVRKCNSINGNTLSGCWLYSYNSADALCPSLVRPATESEIKEELIRQAKERGFVTGLQLKYVTKIAEYWLPMYKGKIKEDYDYRSSEDSLSNYGVPIYQHGEWAKIVKPVGREFYFGDVKVTADKGRQELRTEFGTFTAGQLRSVLMNFGSSNYMYPIPVIVSTVKIGCKEGKVEELREIYKYLVS